MPRIAVVLTFWALVLAALPVQGEPLSEERCGRLQIERQALVALGVENNMAKGPEWAKVNLTDSDLNLIKRFISVSELLKFRCPPLNELAVGAVPEKRGGMVVVPPMPVRRAIPEKRMPIKPPAVQAQPAKVPPPPSAKAVRG